MPPLDHRHCKVGDQADSTQSLALGRCAGQLGCPGLPSSPFHSPLLVFFQPTIPILTFIFQLLGYPDYLGRKHRLPTLASLRRLKRPFARDIFFFHDIHNINVILQPLPLREVGVAFLLPGQSSSPRATDDSGSVRHVAKATGTAGTPRKRGDQLRPTCCLSGCSEDFRRGEGLAAHTCRDGCFSHCGPHCLL